MPWKKNLSSPPWFCSTWWNIYSPGSGLCPSEMWHYDNQMRTWRRLIPLPRRFLGPWHYFLLQSVFDWFYELSPRASERAAANCRHKCQYWSIGVFAAASCRPNEKSLFRIEMLHPSLIIREKKKNILNKRGESRVPSMYVPFLIEFLLFLADAVLTAKEWKAAETKMLFRAKDGAPFFFNLKKEESP